MKQYMVMFHHMPLARRDCTVAIDSTVVRIQCARKKD